MRAAKWILIVIGALVALLAAGVLYITRVVDANRYKPEIQRAVREATGRELKLDGDIELSVFPWVALEMGEGTLGNPPGFDGAPLVAWRDARIAARLLPLLRDQLIVDRIRFSGAQVSLHRLADGRANWDGWGEPQSADARSANNRIDIAGLEITDATLEYRDDRSGDALTLERWQLETSAIRGNTPVELTTAFVAHRGANGPADAAQPRADLQLRARYVPLDGRVLIEQAALSGAVTGIAAQPLPVQLSLPRIEVIGGAQLAQTDWRAEVGSLRASGVVEGAWAEAPAFSGDLRVQSTSLRESLAALGASAPATRDPEVFGALELSLRWQYGPTGLTSRELKIKIDDTHLSGTLEVGPVAPREIYFALAGDSIDLTRYLEPADVVSEPFVFPTATLKALPAHGVLEFARARLGEAELEKLRLRLILDADGARSDRASPP